MNKTAAVALASGLALRKPATRLDPCSVILHILIYGADLNDCAVAIATTRLLSLHILA